MTGILTRGTLVIEIERCKGCELCIPACRPGVLEMSEAVNDMGVAYPVLLPGCTACKACFEVCPDYVFEVYRYDTPIVLPGPAADGQPGPASGEQTGRPATDQGAQAGSPGRSPGGST